ncbi:hypothetical protein A3Q56_00844 [Intoshia linei]|uniref:Uncharacterized protein n=1 Tax=Intoshia linei TaxID=1819745 RepID=A0A177BCP9_9BILA|nr:hypothetical protein A3Q56_00844 [Intoshia linei]
MYLFEKLTKITRQGNIIETFKYFKNCVELFSLIEKHKKYKLDAIFTSQRQIIKQKTIELMEQLKKLNLKCIFRPNENIVFDLCKMYECLQMLIKIDHNEIYLNLIKLVGYLSQMRKVNVDELSKIIITLIEKEINLMDKSTQFTLSDRKLACSEIIDMLIVLTSDNIHKFAKLFTNNSLLDYIEKYIFNPDTGLFLFYDLDPVMRLLGAEPSYLKRYDLVINLNIVKSLCCDYSSWIKVFNTCETIEFPVETIRNYPLGEIILRDFHNQYHNQYESQKKTVAIITNVISNSLVWIQKDLNYKNVMACSSEILLQYTHNDNCYDCINELTIGKIVIVNRNVFAFLGFVVHIVNRNEIYIINIMTGMQSIFNNNHLFKINRHQINELMISSAEIYVKIDLEKFNFQRLFKMVSQMYPIYKSYYFLNSYIHTGYYFVDVVTPEVYKVMLNPKIVEPFVYNQSCEFWQFIISDLEYRKDHNLYKFDIEWRIIRLYLNKMLKEILNNGYVIYENYNILRNVINRVDLSDNFVYAFYKKYFYFNHFEKILPFFGDDFKFLSQFSQFIKQDSFNSHQYVPLENKPFRLFKF